MTYSREALVAYLYGYDHIGVQQSDGSLEVVPEKIVAHMWAGKSVPSGFFDLEGAENVSAVISNASATISKFLRMGVGPGFGSSDVTMVQEGILWDPSSDARHPQRFARRVGEGHDETWIEGMGVYHNPKALRPLDPGLLPGAAHHRLNEEHQVESTAPEWQPLASRTKVWSVRPSP